LKVLLVDDEEEMVSTLAERLTLRGVEADWVTGGKDAIRLVLHNEYDLVVLDVKMPGMNGLETMEEIQKVSPDTKIGFLTGHGSGADRKAGEKGGAGFYLMKPVDIGVLIERMVEVVEQQER